MPLGYTKKKIKLKSPFYCLKGMCTKCPKNIWSGIKYDDEMMKKN
jgi:hypothetical protein